MIAANNPRKTITDQHIECARIYVNKENRASFRVKCFYCGQIFDYFLNFMQHIESRHENLEIAYRRAKPLWMVAENEVRVRQSELNLHEPELVLIAEETSDGLQQFKEENEDNYGIIVDTEKIVEPLIENSLPAEVEVEENGRCTTVKLEIQMVKTEATDPPSDLDCSAKSCQLKKPSNIEDNDERESDSCESTRKRTKNCTQRVRIFYSLRDTNPEIMIDFINIIRNHRCHWDPTDPEHLVKDRRDESAEQIAELLQDRWNITTTAQETRNSILHLCRWFEREYLRSAFRQGENTAYSCVHPEYYRRLCAFLPTQHLKWLKCDECPRRFKTEVLLLSHKHVAHNGEKPYKCQYCPRSFVHLSSFRHHENRHTKERTWPCDLCPYRGVTKTDHMLHMNTHTNIRNYVCSLCGAAYKSSTSLNVHKRTHAPPKLICNICGRRFYENYRLKLHKQKRHNFENESLAEFKCQICDKQFTHMTTFRQHLLQHNVTEEKCKIISENAFETLSEEYFEVETLEDNTFEDFELLKDLNEEVYLDDVT